MSSDANQIGEIGDSLYDSLLRDLEAMREWYVYQTPPGSQPAAASSSGFDPQQSEQQWVKAEVSLHPAATGPQPESDKSPAKDMDLDSLLQQ